MVSKTKPSVKETLEYLSMDEIQPNRNQPRKNFNSKELEELADSIDEQGLVQPIIVRPITDGIDPVTHELIAGERRWRAHEILKKKRIKCVIKPDVGDTDSQSSALIENIQRDDLNPAEESAAIVKFMKDNKLTQQQAAQKLAKSRAYISNIVRIAKLPIEVQDLVTKGKLKKQHAFMLVGAPKATQTELGEKAADEGWNLEKLKRNIAKADPKKQAEVAKKKAEKEAAKNAKPNDEDLLLLVQCKNADELKELKDALKEEEYTFWTQKKVLKQLDSILNPPEDDEKEAA